MICEVAGCTNPTRGKKPRGVAYCSPHYQRWLKSGKVTPEPSKPLSVSSVKGMICYVEECERPVRCSGLCSKHYENQARETTCSQCQKIYQGRGTLCRDCYLSLNDYDKKTEHTCRNCGETKPIEEFGWRKSGSNPTSPTKVRSRCRDCESRKARESNHRLTAEERAERKKRYRLAEEARFDAMEGEEKEQFLWKKLLQSIRHSSRRLGLDAEMVIDRFIENGNVCEVCGVTPEGRFKRVAVDHDHRTGEFRGFLCGPCNTKLGHLESDEAERLLQYLKNRVVHHD